MLFLYLIIYQGLHTDLEYDRPAELSTSGWSASSEKDAWFCSESVSSMSEQRSSEEMMEGAGDTSVVYWVSDTDKVLLFPGHSTAVSGNITWRRSSSFRGMLSRRWLRSSAAMVGSIPGQPDTKVCTSCMHWM